MKAQGKEVVRAIESVRDDCKELYDRLSDAIINAGGYGTWPEGRIVMEHLWNVMYSAKWIISTGHYPDVSAFTGEDEVEAEVKEEGEES